MYFPLEAKTLFPPVPVEERQLVSWKENPATADLLMEIHRRLYQLNLDSLRASSSPEAFHEKRGESHAYITLLEWLEIRDVNITTPDEVEE
jgi:hypothetical protein